MITNVARWGNSLALRIPSAFAREISVHEGGAVEISIENGTLVVRPMETPTTFDLDELLRGITAENLHAEVSTGEPVGNEV